MNLARCMMKLCGCILPQSQIQKDEKVQGQEDGSCVQPPPAQHGGRALSQILRRSPRCTLALSLSPPHSTSAGAATFKPGSFTSILIAHSRRTEYGRDAHLSTLSSSLMTSGRLYMPSPRYRKNAAPMIHSDASSLVHTLRFQDRSGPFAFCFDLLFLLGDVRPDVEPFCA